MFAPMFANCNKAVSGKHFDDSPTSQQQYFDRLFLMKTQTVSVQIFQPCKLAQGVIVKQLMIEKKY